jgi:hypothetical protein
VTESLFAEQCEPFFNSIGHEQTFGGYKSRWKSLNYGERTTDRWSKISEAIEKLRVTCARCRVVDAGAL